MTVVSTTSIGYKAGTSMYRTAYSNPFTLRGTPESIVCYSHTFENNLGIKLEFAKYLKKICCLASGQHFSLKCFFFQNMLKQ